ncbi:LicD family protein [Lachnospiraceae bacterium 62-26]
MDNKNSKYDLSQLHKIEIEILNEVVKICNNNGLKYSLAFGTLLGAVRHKGFIPWDDDIDIIMPRVDYEKFLTIWKKEASSQFILQNKYTDSSFSQNFTKIRKDQTAFLQNEDEKFVNYHTGIFIDIFPADRVAPGLFRKIQIVACVVNLLYSREKNSGDKGVKRIIEASLLSLPKKVQYFLWKVSSQYIARWKLRLDLPIFFPCTMEYIFKEYSNELLDDYIELEFCGKFYNCVMQYREMLSIDYGDYMKLPHEKDRVQKHPAIFVDLNCNFKE